MSEVEQPKYSPELVKLMQVNPIVRRVFSIMHTGMMHERTAFDMCVTALANQNEFIKKHYGNLEIEKDLEIKILREQRNNLQMSFPRSMMLGSAENKILEFDNEIIKMIKESKP